MKRLTLRTERLTELSPDDLGSVAGAQYLPTQQCTGYYTTIDAPCATIRTSDVTTITQ